ncbi:MAG TPA: pseudouridine synthase [Pirellulales bacterium]|nr:pseudouridine synthase [Pirellulales bacterium]
MSDRFQPRSRNSTKNQSKPLRRRGKASAAGGGASALRLMHPTGSTHASDAADPAGGTERLQKVLAAAGIGSRRKCEELIRAGRITVDGRTVTELGTKVDPDEVEIRVDGEPLPRTKRLYYLVNKPTGVVSTNRDPSGRRRVIDLLPFPERLFTVGRLDLSSEGLILVTNDGELANLLAHPRYGVEKTYHAQVVGVPEPEVLDRLRQGVHLAEGFAHAKRVSVKSQHKQSALLEIVLDEGRNREVRRLLARVGHKVLRLKRVALGPLRLADLPPGEFRPLKRDEVRALKEAARASIRAGGADPQQAVGSRQEAIARSRASVRADGASPDVSATIATVRVPHSKPGPSPAGRKRFASRRHAPRRSSCHPVTLSTSQQRFSARREPPR